MSGSFIKLSSFTIALVLLIVKKYTQYSLFNALRPFLDAFVSIAVGDKYMSEKNLALLATSWCDKPPVKLTLFLTLWTKKKLLVKNLDKRLCQDRSVRFCGIQNVTKRRLFNPHFPFLMPNKM